VSISYLRREGKSNVAFRLSTITPLQPPLLFYLHDVLVLIFRAREEECEGLVILVARYGYNTQKEGDPEWYTATKAKVSPEFGGGGDDWVRLVDLTMVVLKRNGGRKVKGCIARKRYEVYRLRRLLMVAVVELKDANLWSYSNPLLSLPLTLPRLKTLGLDVADNVDVTVPLQFFTQDSHLSLPSGSKSGMLGFYDVAKNPSWLYQPAQKVVNVGKVPLMLGSRQSGGYCPMADT